MEELRQTSGIGRILHGPLAWLVVVGIIDILDVYKRQFKAWCKSRFMERPGEPYVIWEEGAAKTVKDDNMAVSYTHLDVYKRQSLASLDWRWTIA